MKVHGQAVERKTKPVELSTGVSVTVGRYSPLEMAIEKQRRFPGESVEEQSGNVLIVLDDKTPVTEHNVLSHTYMALKSLMPGEMDFEAKEEDFKEYADYLKAVLTEFEQAGFNTMDMVNLSLAGQGLSGATKPEDVATAKKNSSTTTPTSSSGTSSTKKAGPGKRGRPSRQKKEPTG